MKIGDSVDIEVEDFMSPLDATGKGVRVSGVGFPADTLACGTAVSSSLSAFGLEFSNIGKNAHSSSFSWSA